MYTTIVILPIIASISTLLFGRSVGRTGTQIITTGSIIITAIFSMIAFYEVVISRSSVSVNNGQWMVTDFMNVSWDILFDDLTVSMLIVVTIVSGFVHLYSCSYISDDPHVQRFISYLTLFTGSIIFLVVANNYLTMFVGKILPINFIQYAGNKLNMLKSARFTNLQRLTL